MTSSSPIVIQIDGGIGRLICATPAIELLSKIHCERRIIVLASHPHVFLENPHIYKTYGLQSDYLWEDVIKHGEFRYPEPYHNYQYYTQKHHLIQTFNLLLTGQDDFILPKIYLTQAEKAWGEDFIQTRKKEFDRPVVLLQHAGAGASQDADGKLVDDTYRSLPNDQLNYLLNNLTEFTFINASHIPIQRDNVWNQEFTLRQLFSLAHACDLFVGVDSFASHATAAFDKKGVLILGGTFKENVGYPNFETFYKKGYPKAYHPNRFSGYLPKQNEGAMRYSEEEMVEIVNAIKNLKEGN